MVREGLSFYWSLGLLRASSCFPPAVQKGFIRPKEYTCSPPDFTVLLARFLFLYPNSSEPSSEGISVDVFPWRYSGWGPRHSHGKRVYGSEDMQAVSEGSHKLAYEAPVVKQVEARGIVQSWRSLSNCWPFGLISTICQVRSLRDSLIYLFKHLGL